MAYLESLKAENKLLKEKLEKVEEDREKFRTFFLQLLKSNVSMASKNEYFGPGTMIEKLSKLLNSVQSWWWP